MKIVMLQHYPKEYPLGYMHDGDSGIDLRSTGNFVLRPGENAIIPTGIAVELPPGCEGQVRPRSGLAAKGIVANFGTIDNGYRGEIMVVLFNLSNEVFMITRGERVAQLVIAKVERPVLEFSGILSSTERGSDGFGSTGTL